MFSISYWDEYDIIHNNKGKSASAINSKIDDLYCSVGSKIKNSSNNNVVKYDGNYQ